MNSQLLKTITYVIFFLHNISELKKFAYFFAKNCKLFSIYFDIIYRYVDFDVYYYKGVRIYGS